MRGFPPIEILFLAALFLAVVFPLLQLTGENVASPVVELPKAEAVAAVPVYGRLKVSSPPSSLTLAHGGVVLAEAAGEFEFDAPADGCELELMVGWPEGVPESAVEVVLEPEGLESQSRTVWGEGGLEEILTFSWEGGR